MNLVTLDNVTKRYGERLLLDGANLLINSGDRIGLLGRNGSGKTTLLRIIAGEETADAGTVTVWGNVRVRFLPQEPRLEDDLTVLETVFQSNTPQIQLLQKYEQTSYALQQAPHDKALQARLIQLSNEMDRHDGWAAEANAKAILTRLGIDAFDTPVGILSGGQRKRVALARALIDPGDLLLLDEPTNHIDADTIDWLEAFLTTMQAALLMVTHDRYFLERVVNRIVELDRRELVNYPGNYARYLEARARREELAAAREEKRQAHLRRELEWLRRGAMARSTKQKARKQRIAELQQLRYDRSDSRVALALAGRRLGKKVLAVRGLRKAYGDLCLFDNLDFSLVPGDRIGIVGPNGAGKTTFLDVLAGKIAPDRGEVDWGPTVELGYFDQRSEELLQNEEQRLEEYIGEAAPLIYTADGQRVEAAQMLEWFLFSRPEQRTRLKSLSGGERRRVYLLRTLVHRPNVLFLDEPTNDLDVQTLNVLEEFLDNFQGCLVVVSHDRYFLDRNVDFIMSFEDGVLGTRYPTPYRPKQVRADVDRRTEGEKKQARAKPAQATEPKTKRAQARPRKLTWKEERELEATEERMAELEDKITILEEKINASGHDYQRLTELSAQLQAVNAELEDILARWLELSEIAERT